MDFIQSKIKEALNYDKDGKIDSALEIYNNLLKKDKNNFNLLYLIGMSYTKQKKFELAANFFEKATVINSASFAALNNLGAVLIELKKYNDAIEKFKKIKSDYSNYNQVLSNIATCYSSLRNFDKAKNIYFKLIEENINDYVSLNNLGNIFYETKEYEKAIKYFFQAINIQSDYFVAYNNLGTTYQELNQIENSIDNYLKALKINKNYVPAIKNLGDVYKKINNKKKALEYYKQVKTIDKNFQGIDLLIFELELTFCDWENYENNLEIFYNSSKNNFHIQPFLSLLLTDNAKLQKKIAKNFVEKNYSFHKKKTSVYKNLKSKIKIGYFSSDFRDHPVLQLFFDVLKNHNRSKFEIYGFSILPIGNDSLGNEAKKYFSEFIDISKKSDSEVVKICKDKQIDIAVDLNGFTYFARTAIFALRASPIQINYLGYPGTMGSEFIDYLIADKTIIPKENKNKMSEEIIYLPNCYQPNQERVNISDKNLNRSNFGIPDDKFVFCNFNKTIKINPTIYNSWMNILKKTPNSILWILNEDNIAQRNIIYETKRRGVSPERIFFASKILKEEHLKRMKLCDLFLDTYPYGAHTVGSDAVRMGLPIITIIGETFASRVSASILKQVKLEKLVCNSFGDYENLAIKLANDFKLMNAIKNNLKNSLKDTPLFNSKRYTKDLENLYISLIKNK